MSSESIAVIGAGPAGLTAAYLLAKSGRQVLVFETDPDYVGGISKTVAYKGFHFDIGGHRFFSKSKEVEDFWTEILPDDMLDRPRSSRILYRNRFFSYPLRAVEALLKLGIFESLLCVLSYAKARVSPVKNPRNFEEWVSNQFGRRLFNIFFKTYTEKVWGTPCTEISADWAAQRIKGLSLSTAIINALLPKRKSRKRGAVVKTLIDSFRYPRLGPGMLWERCTERIREMGGTVLMGRRVSQCSFDENAKRWSVTTMDTAGAEETFTASEVISTTPIRELAAVLAPALHQTASAAAGLLKYRDFITVAVILKERDLFHDNWIYIHDPSVQVGRIQNFKSWSPEMVPDPSLACYGMEYFCFEKAGGLWGFKDEELRELASRELVQLGLAKAVDIVDACVVRQRKAYPVYDDAYADHVATVRTELEKRFPSLHLIGRNGMHKYNNQDHSMMTAMLCAKNILAGHRQYDLWQVNEDAEYHEEGDAGSEAAPESAGASGLRQVPRRIAPAPAPAPERSWFRRLIRSRRGVFLLIAMISLPFVLTLGMTKNLSHDEHQHVAAGALLARAGLLPYEDVQVFHTPYLAFVYGLIFKVTNQLLLGARLFSVGCGILIASLLGVTAFQLFRERGTRVAWLACGGAVALILSSTVFTLTTGRAWNQEPALLCTVAAFLLHVPALARGSVRRLVGSGILLGLAVGFRITYAPLVAPFALAFFFAPEIKTRRFALLGWFAGGITLGMAGVLWLFAISPEQAFFDNFQFAKVNIEYRFGTGEPRTMTLLKKLRFAYKEVVRPDLGLALAFAVAVGASFLIRRAAGLRRLEFPMRCLLLMLPFLLIGSIAPSPVFEQYFYPFTAFLVLGAAYALASIPQESRWLRPAALGAGAGVLLSVALGGRSYREMPKLATLSKWTPIEVHGEGRELRARVRTGEILTLAPIYALEGGFAIYPSFATGPFAWRISAFVDPAKAKRLRMATPNTLEAMLANNPPEAVLVGFEKRGEDQLIAYARRNHYKLVPQEDNGTLWVSP